MDSSMALRIALGVSFTVASIAYWIVVGSRGHEAFRRRCERRFRVTIDDDGKGRWSVRSDDGRWFRNFAIEFLQLGFFMALFLGWAVLLVTTWLIAKVVLG
jgi:hypothetical protein